MSFLKKAACLASVRFLGFAGIGLAAVPAFGADIQPASTCALTAQAPVKTGGTGMRSYGGTGNCSNPATVTVMLKRDIPNWPDSIVSSEKRTGVTNSHWNVYGNGAYGSRYYTQTDSSTGASLSSSRITL